jgi:hypothetical protein
VIRYKLIYPVLFKLFAATAVTRKFYRFLGNTLRDKIKSKKQLRENYIYQGRRINSLMKNYCAISKGDSLLELGTGWLHWYGTFVRLFNDVKIYAYDVWDNRQFSTLREYYKQLATRLGEKELAHNNTKDLLDKIKGINSFDEFYDVLGMEYIVEENGSLNIFPNNKFNALLSCAVFEHIPKNNLPQYFSNMYKILKPGGYSIQIIDIGDHYTYLDKRGTHRKQYLQYSNKWWTFYYNNQLSYVNRLQASDWLELFDKAGFELIFKEEVHADIEDFKVAKDFEKYSKNDLKCHQLVVVHKKPKMEVGRNNNQTPMINEEC